MIAYRIEPRFSVWESLNCKNLNYPNPKNKTRRTTGMKKIIIISTLAAATAANAWIGANSTDFVRVGDAGNAADGNGLGAVNYEYSIGKYEVSANEYVNFLNAVGSVSVDVNGSSLYLYHPVGTINGRGTISVSGSSVAVKDGKDSNPVNYVSAYAAAMYANWLCNGAKSGAYDFATYGASIEVFSNRNRSAKYWLATADEWYKAAYYSPELNGGAGGYFAYATQSNEPPAASMPTAELNCANYDNITDDMCTTIAGSYINSPSYYGTFDQAGNVSEWNEDIDGQNLVRRGGAYDSTSWHIRSAYSVATDPAVEIYNIGFRLASSDGEIFVPEPAEYGLAFAVAAIALLALRRRK